MRFGFLTGGLLLLLGIPALPAAAPPPGGAANWLLRRSMQLAHRDVVAAQVPARQALTAARQRHDVLGQAAALGQLAQLCLPRGQYDSAAQLLDVQQALVAHLPRRAAGALGAAIDRAAWLAARAEMAAAVDQYTGALALLPDSVSYPDLRIRALIGAGVACTNMRQRERAIAYLSAAERTARAVADSAALATVWVELGFLRKLAHDSAGTAAYAARTAALCTRRGYRIGLARALSLRGNLLNETGHFEPAEVSYRQAQRLAFASGDQIRTAYAFVNRGINFRSAHQYDSAQAAFKAALRICTVLHNRRGRREALTGLATTYAALGKFELAYAHENKYAQLRDSILNDNFTRQLAEADTRYQATERAQQVRIQALDLRRRTLLAGGLALALVAALLVSAALLGRARARQRAAVAEEARLQQHAATAAVLEAEERERRRIGAELHDGVGQLLSAAKLNLSGLQHELQPTLTSEATGLLVNALDSLDESVREVRTLSHQLVPNALLRQGLGAAVQELVQKVTLPGQLRIELELVGVEQRLAPALESALYRIIQELLANVVKHARATDVTLQLLHHGPELTVLLEDNGVGFDLAAVQARPSGGIGLRNLTSRVELLGGRLYFDTRAGRGTSVTVEVPVRPPGG